MKAVTLIIGEHRNALVDSLDYPTPQLIDPHQVLIRIKATSVNPIDLQMFQGRKELKSSHSDILGRELAGVIEAIGPEVKNFRVADEVYLAVSSLGSNGSFATQVVVDEQIVAHKPQHISFKQAAVLPIAYSTAWQIISRMKVAKTSKIVILGASGSVGQALINLLQHVGYTNIVATAGQPYSRDQLLKLQLLPQHILNYKEPQLVDRLLKINTHKFFDVVIDCVGNQMTEVGAAVLKREGLYIDVTNLKTEEASDILFDKAANIMNIAGYAATPLFYKYGETLNQLTQLIKDKPWHLQEYMDLGTLSATNLQHAFDLLANNLSKGKKLVFSVE